MKDGNNHDARTDQPAPRRIWRSWLWYMVIGCVAGCFFYYGRPSAEELVDRYKLDTTDQPVARVGGNESRSFVVDGIRLTIPSPNQFYRIDGRDVSVDRALETLRASTNSLLAFYASETDLADALMGDWPELRRSCNVQYFSEQPRISQREFDALAAHARSNFEQLADAVTEGFPDFDQQIESLGRDVLGSTMVLRGLDSIPLRIDHEDSDSLLYSQLIRMDIVTEAGEERTVGAASVGFLRVRGVLLFIYTNSMYDSEEDLAWARLANREWRDAIIASNR